MKDKDFIPVTHHVTLDWGGWQEYAPDSRCKKENCKEDLVWHPITQEYQINGTLGDIGSLGY